MSHRRLDALEAIIVQGLKWVVGKSATSKQVSGATLMREFNIPPIYAYAAGQVVRLVEKFRDMDSWLSILIAGDVPKRKRTSPYSFLYRYDRWMNRRSRCTLRHHMKPGQLSEAVLEFTWEEWDRTNGGASLPTYQEGGFQKTRAWYLSAVSFDSEVRAAGVRFLCQARLNCLAFSPMVRGRRPVQLVCCPLCGELWNPYKLELQLEHLVFACFRLADPRARLLPRVLAQFIGHGSLSPGDRIRLALGGANRQGARLDRWSGCFQPPPHEATQDRPASGLDALSAKGASAVMAAFLGLAIPKVCKAVQNG